MTDHKYRNSDTLSIDNGNKELMYAYRYVQVVCTNRCTRLIVSYLTGQINSLFTEAGIQSVSPESIDEVDSIYKLIKIIGAESEIDGISKINKFMRITLKKFTDLNDRNLLDNQMIMRNEYCRIIKSISDYKSSMLNNQLNIES